MDKEEAYKAHYPDSPELYEESIKNPADDGFVELLDIIPKAKENTNEYDDVYLGTGEPMEQEIIEYASIWNIILALGIGLVLGSTLIIILLYSGAIPQFVSVDEIDARYWEAYNTGMLDVSNAAQDEGVIPVFKNVNGKVVFDREIKIEVVE